MKATFYDVKMRKKLEAEVADKVKYDNNRFAIRAKTPDGRNLTKFVKKADWDKMNV